MKTIIALILTLALASCGKEDVKTSGANSLDSRLYGKQWVNNSTYQGHGAVYTIDFSGNTALYKINVQGGGSQTTTYTLTPTGPNTATSFNGTTNSDWTYTVTATTLNVCIGINCMAFGI